MARFPEDRERLAWWTFTTAMVGFFLFVLWSFVGTVVFGISLESAPDSTTPGPDNSTSEEAQKGASND